MKRKNYLQLIPILCLLAVLIGFAANNSLVNINKVSVEPGILKTKIILGTSSPLPPPRTYYLKDNPSTIVLELDRVNTTQEPQLVRDESSLVERIRMEKTGTNKHRFLISLKERVPYRIFSDQDSTVVELTKIQRALEEYVLDPETKKELAKRPKTEILLEKIDISEEKDGINITTKLSDKTVYNVFALENPLRLVIDLFNTLYPERTSVYPVKKLGVEQVRTAQFQMANPYTITRIVFDLTEPQLYAINSEKNELVVSFFKDGSPAPLPRIVTPAPETPEPKKTQVTIPQKPEKIAQKEKAPEPEPKESKAALKKPEIKQVKEATPQMPVKGTQKEKARVEKAPEPVEKKTKKTAPQKLDDVSDLLRSTQSSEISPAQTPPQEEQVKPKTIAERSEKYQGEIIAQLKFKDADLRDVVLYLGDFGGLNTVFDPEVRGKVTCNLKYIPWDQALDLILKINKMGKIIEGNVLRIAPVQSLTREQQEQRRLSDSKEMAEPLLTKTFYLSYSKVNDVQGLLRTKVSTRGEIIVDVRTNTLTITDIKERLELIERLISVFDTPTPQVSIEARIVEASATFARNLGIQWGFRGIADPFYGNQTSLQFPNKALIDGAMIPQGSVTKGIAGPLGGYAINLPAPAFNTALGLSFANVLDTFRLDMALSALETAGEGRIISCPNITTQNNQEAEIIQGRQIPVQTVANFTTTTTFRNAALELRATPQITPEGTIIMDIEIRNNAADFANLVNGIPPITTQSARTRVMVPDGGTTVIGGIYRTEDSITREKVPFLHKIPILGLLFRNFARTKQNRELLIFITPRIIKL